MVAIGTGKMGERLQKSVSKLKRSCGGSNGGGNGGGNEGRKRDKGKNESVIPSLRRSFQVVSNSHRQIRDLNGI